VSSASSTVSGLRLRVGSATDVGRVRDHNEDDLVAEGAVFAVADGMGGHAAGEVASGIAVDTLRGVAESAPLAGDDVVAALAEANERMLESVAQHPEQAGMGTTAAGLAVVTSDGSTRWAVFNVGDSRVYRYAEGQLTLVTVDHSEVRELVDAGLITEAEAARHPLRNVITRSLGAGSMPAVDLWILPPQVGERFLVCSDGLNGELDDDQVRALLDTHEDPHDAAVALVDAAVAAGGRDNVSVVVVALDAFADAAHSDGVGAAP
jgi:PPM family protein phosphatase